MWQERAVRQIRELFQPVESDGLVRCIEAAATFSNAQSVFRRIAQAKDAETILDHFVEIKFAITFAELGFVSKFEPCGEKGPDLLVSRDGQSAHVEVKRFRPSEKENDLASLTKINGGIDNAYLFLTEMRR
jgi:hypothetical protein